MIPIALLERFTLRVGVRYIIADSSKPHKGRNLYTIRSTARNVTIQKRKNFISKSKSSRVTKNPFAIKRCQYKKGASVSVVLALFNCSSLRSNDLIDHTFEIRIVNVRKVPGSRNKGLDNTSLIVMVKRVHAISFVAV